MADSIEQFNQHQADAKSRLNFLAQLILFIAGGALTASIAVFTGSRTIALSAQLAKVLSYSWWLLVASICLTLVCLTTILLRDYFFAEQWRKSFDDPSRVPDDSPGWADFLVIASGVTSVLSAIFGLVAIAYVASSVVIP